MSDDQTDDLDLRSLSDEELVEQMHDDLYDGLKEEIEEGTNILLERGWSADKVLADALVEVCVLWVSILETAFCLFPRC